MMGFLDATWKYFVEIGPLAPERRFLKGFYHIWSGGHLGHVTQMPRKDFCITYPNSLHIKFDIDWPSGLLEDV